MADLAQVMQALRNADTAGNVEDAKRLAAIAAKLREQDDTPRLIQEPEPVSGYRKLEPIPETPSKESTGVLPFVNRAIAETLGAPVDALTAVVNRLPGPAEPISQPFGGRKSFERGMESVGATLPAEGQTPETGAEHIGRGVGEVAGMLTPAGAAVMQLAKRASLAGRVASSVWSSIVRHPYLAMVSETTGGVGMGAGRAIAEKEFPDSPAARTSVELASGLAGAVAPTVALHAPTAVAIRAGKNILYKLIIPFKKEGGMHRAGEYVKGLVADPGKVARAVTEETISDLPPAVASGEKKLVTLYKSLMGQEPTTDAEAIEKLTTSMIKLESEMRRLGYGSPELLTEITQKRVAALELKMDRRIIEAAGRAQQKLEALPAAKRKAAESRIVRQELTNVMREEQKAVQSQWAKVNKDFKVDTETTRQTYESLKADLGQAQRVDIPAALKRSSIIKGKKAKGPSAKPDTRPEVTPGEVPPLPPKGRSGFITPETKGEMIDFEGSGSTIREMQSLRSKLLETSRRARKEGEWNKSRIAEDVADAILEDISIASEATPEAADLKAAIAATKQFKMRFESGEVGKLLGYSKSGAPAINPDLALDMTVGRMGERGAVDISKIVVTPEAEAATKRYLGRSFTDFATDPKSGAVNPIKAERWIKNNEAILDKFPDLRKQMADTAESQTFADRTKAAMQARKKSLQDPRISVSAQYLNKADMGTEISSIFKSKRPSAMANELVKQAKKDPTGGALEGLRAGFVEHILEKSTLGSFNELGEQTLSGRAMLNFVKKNESTLRTVFDNVQILRMKKIGGELSKIETFEKMHPGKTELELKDWASNTLRMFGRLTGARLGGKLGAESMGGSLQYAGIFANRAQKFMTWLSKDTAQQLVHDAILSKDPALLKSLLKPIAKPRPSKKDLIILNKNLNLWLLGTGKRVIEE